MNYAEDRIDRTSSYDLSLRLSRAHKSIRHHIERNEDACPDDESGFMSLYESHVLAGKTLRDMGKW